MNVLLHSCCAPCTIYPLQELRREGYHVSGYFFNPNIHPFKEFQRRLHTLEQFAKITQFELTAAKEYGLKEFLRKIVFNEDIRCDKCYDMRLLKTAEKAKDDGFDAFSTTLLYSKYQNHKLIKEKCNSLSELFDISFLYRDYRTGWQEGIDTSIKLDLYRQPYCGCIYSEQERYDNRWKKKNRKRKTT
ncbi:MAG: epoxyqueuosine reductase QueH [Bacteroidetes bacterium]|nr:epoxyqueuosine reductase QueH [Bacteroidota bacterium]